MIKGNAFTRSIYSNRKKTRTSVSWENGGNALHPSEYTALDISRLNPGDYVLKMTVKDLNTGKTVSTEDELKIVK